MNDRLKECVRNKTDDELWIMLHRHSSFAKDHLDIACEAAHEIQRRLKKPNLELVKNE